MRRLVAPIIILTILFGVEGVARRIESRMPTPLLWDTQFTQDKADQIAGLGDQLEVVFAGSSVVQANVDPVLFVETSAQYDTAYNAAIPSATPRIWREWIRDTIYLETCPAVIVIGVDLRQFSDNKPGTNGQLHRYLTSRGRDNAIGNADGWEQAEDWLEDQSALFRLRSRIREPDKVVAWVWEIGDLGDWRYTNLTPLGRYGSFDNVVYERSPERIEILSNGAFLDLSLGGAETDALRMMIVDAFDHGALPVLVEMPTMYDQLAKALPNGNADIETFSAILEGVAAEFGIPLIRLPELDNRPELFADEYHMNRTGVDTVTPLLAKRIDALNLDAATGICDPP
ncbi:MAG: hypothetical protein U9N84_00535 [Actinomycetota bacterium]|nr:hypothetical protein [Actinomycetota bacterium]